MQAFTNNTSTGAGGVQNNGIFNMYGGYIKDNQGGRLGGGVRNDGTFRMAGGTISNNIATSGNGGGIYTDTNSKMTLSLKNTTITGNKAANESGGGIYYMRTLTLRVITYRAIPVQQVEELYLAVRQIQ